MCILHSCTIKIGVVFVCRIAWNQIIYWHYFFNFGFRIQWWCVSIAENCMGVERCVYVLCCFYLEVCFFIRALFAINNNANGTSPSSVPYLFWFTVHFAYCWLIPNWKKENRIEFAFVCKSAYGFWWKKWRGIERDDTKSFCWAQALIREMGNQLLRSYGCQYHHFFLLCWKWYLHWVSD